MTRRYKGMDLLTSAVMQARDILVRQTEEMTKVYQPGTFMTRKVDPRTLDKYLMNITPEDMVKIAMTDPAQAEKYAGRINTLEQRSRPALPAQDAYSPEE